MNTVQIIRPGTEELRMPIPKDWKGEQLTMPGLELKVLPAPEGWKAGTVTEETQLWELLARHLLHLMELEEEPDAGRKENAEARMEAAQFLVRELNSANLCLHTADVQELANKNPQAFRLLVTDENLQSKLMSHLFALEMKKMETQEGYKVKETFPIPIETVEEEDAPTMDIRSWAMAAAMIW